MLSLIEKIFKPYDFEENLCSTPGSYWIVILLIILLLLPALVLQIMWLFGKKPVVRTLSGKVVLITGASSGLGEALGYEFYRLGCKVILSSRNEGELDRVRKMIMKEREDLGDVRTYPPVVLPLDLEEINSLPAKADAALSLYGHIDILVNNAGMSYRGRVVNTDMNVDMRLMNVNYFGHVALTKAILPSMISRKDGHILFVSSVQGLIGIPNRSAYVASKHALQGFSDSLRSEIAAHNIKVTVLSPGYMRTKLSKNSLTGNGEIYGITDEATANGLDPTYVAIMAVKAVLDEKKELVVATWSPKVAIFFRHIFPRIFFQAMELRAKPKK